MFGRRQWVAALLVPVGVVASHLLGYLVAHPDPRDRAVALGASHGHLPVLGLLSAAAAVAALGMGGAAGRRGERLVVRIPALAAAQAAVFVAMEVAEHVAHGDAVSSAVTAPSLWWGLAVQLVVAAVSVALLRLSHAVGAAVGRDRRRRCAGRVRVVALAAGNAPAIAARYSPLSRRGPPPVLGT